MGGVSRGTLHQEQVQGRPAWRLRGDVSLENNGGFIQMAADLQPGGAPLDVSGFASIAFEATGNGETYNLHLRTSDLTRPWQSYRQSFIAGPDWQTHRVPFSDFAPHRTEAPLDLTTLRRLGFLAIGRAFEADLSIGAVRFYT
ncbi:MAG: CIA30 family protein [Devosiaceae bacterium]|nr:CIA30 family protein [Devosiaceae bacterium MH13]